eukprot:g77800.t1
MTSHTSSILRKHRVLPQMSYAQAATVHLDRGGRHLKAPMHASSGTDYTDADNDWRWLGVYRPFHACQKRWFGGPFFGDTVWELVAPNLR